jgi:hypothetical protein
VVFLKKIFIMAFVLLGLISIPFSTGTYATSVETDGKPLLNKYREIENSKEELYKDIFITLLEPYTEKAIADYYSKYLNSPPQEDPWYVKVLNVERPRPKSFEFVIKVEVAPYIGPHNSVGIDHITFNVNSSGDVKLEKFEHIKSFEIVPGYQSIIKTWPPK